MPEIVISFPESLNGDTGQVYSYLGESHEFERMTVKAILNRAMSQKTTHTEPTADRDVYTAKNHVNHSKEVSH